jgi:hypothetical protein
MKSSLPVKFKTAREYYGRNRAKAMKFVLNSTGNGRSVNYRNFVICILLSRKSQKIQVIISLERNFKHLVVNINK